MIVDESEFKNFLYHCFLPATLYETAARQRREVGIRSISQVKPQLDVLLLEFP